jgi:glycosyltransferase involved in cell wall biosynthesis
MRILFCCQFYAPSGGGVQEVVRQIAERMAIRGHHVTVATVQSSSRDFDTLNGVHIKEFAVSGNAVGGMRGEREIERYRDYVVHGDFDLVMIKAAQQWTFDALWPVLDRIKIPKVFIPCGFSGLYEPAYAAYYRQMPEVLRKFDHLIFYASRYRDINLTREHGLENFSILPNGASEMEFNVAADLSFRERHGIPERSFLFLTVGSLKGHLELAKAFSAMTLGEGEHATLILNGNACPLEEETLGGFWNKLTGSVRIDGFRSTFRKVFTRIMEKTGVRIGRETTPQGVARIVNRTQPNKRVLLTDYPRHDLIQAFMAADLFVFASNVEYSPLVLFESAAAGTPFLTVPVGNAEEIAHWTGGGVVCPAARDAKGYTRVDPSELAQFMSRLVRDEALRKKLGAEGRRNWQEKFTWEKISREYEAIFLRLVKGRTANA